MWPQYLHNAQIIHGTFGDRFPKLEGLSVTQILLSSGCVALGLECKGLPDDSPSRWHEKRYDMLEFRFSFNWVSDLSIAGTPPASGFNVTLQLEQGAAKLVSPDPHFIFALKFHLVELDLHPFNARVACDLQERWFRQS